MLRCMVGTTLMIGGDSLTANLVELPKTVPLHLRYIKVNKHIFPNQWQLDTWSVKSGRTGSWNGENLFN